MDKIDSPNAVSRPRQWLRGIRPLLWWLLFVLLLFAYHTHQRLLEQTRLTFSIRLQGRPVPPEEVTALLDGTPIQSGDRIFLGRHKLTFSHQKAVAQATNLVIWYGKHDLGVIDLKRSFGTLSIKSDPKAQVITVQGPEYSMGLTNSTGITSTVPTDRYLVEATYGHSRQNGEAVVSDGSLAPLYFQPALGIALVKCNQEGATFRLLSSDGQTVESGGLPAVVVDLPEGNYTLETEHHGHQLGHTLVVKAFATNEVGVEFRYGSANLETDPAGAGVTTSQGEPLGTTPLHLSEITAGEHTFILRKDGYDSVSVTLGITENSSSSFRTNLFNLNFAQAMERARQALASGNVDAALSAATDALAVKPTDPEALALRNEAFAKRNIHQAEEQGKQGLYAAAIQSLEAALEAQPENSYAKQLLADFQKQELERTEKQAQARLGKPKALFDATLVKVNDADLFETHELRTGKAVMEVRAAVDNQLRTVAPNFQIIYADTPSPELFRIEAKEELIGGLRSCVIVGGRVKDDETQIIFKVLEYKTHYGIKLQGLNLVQTTERIPVHPSRIPEMTDRLKLQVVEGTRIVTERIERAIGGK